MEGEVIYPMSKTLLSSQMQWVQGCPNSLCTKNVCTNILIDNGWRFPIIDENLYQMIPNKPTTQLVAANGKSLKLLGELQLILEVEKKVFPCRAVMGKDVVDPMIVAVEFIVTNGGVINFKDQQLALDSTGEQIDENNTSNSEIDIPCVP